MLFTHGVAILAGARRARIDRRDAARAGSAAAASSVAGVNTSAIAELLAVAQLWAATMRPVTPFHPVKKTPNLSMARRL